MKRSRVFLLLLAGILMMGLFIGCSQSSSAPNNSGQEGETTGNQGTGETNNEVNEEYPVKPITLIVNYDAGGQTDTIYRILAQYAEQHFGKPVVVKNVTGGGGTVGIAELAKAKNDGYTLGNTSSAPMTVNPQTQDVSYTIDSFDYIGAWGQILAGVLVKKDSPYQSIKELAEASKNNPLKFANTQPGGILDYAIQDIIATENANWISVPTQGLSEGVAAVLGGHTDFLVSSVPPSGLDELRLLVSLSSVRWPAYPDVSTAEELGYKLHANARLALAGPAGMPDHVIKKWEEVLQKILNDPKFVEEMQKFGVPIDFLPGEQYKQELKEQFEYFKNAIK